MGRLTWALLMSAVIPVAPAWSQEIGALKAASPVAQPAAAAAPQDQGQASGAIEEVVVTARSAAERPTVGTKSDVPLLETPVSVAVIPRSVLDTLNVVNVAEALKLNSSIQSNEFGNRSGDGGADVVIRGFRNPLVLIDGLRGSGDVAIQSIEQIEILKGPASILYGDVAPGGIISYTRKRPTPSPAFNAGIDIGNYDFYRGYVDVGGPLSSTVSARLNASVTDRESFVNGLYGRSQYIDPVVNWRPDNKTTIILFADYQHEDFLVQPSLPAEGTLLSNPNGRIPISFNFDDFRFSGDKGNILSGGIDAVRIINQDWSLRLAGTYTSNRGVARYGVIDSISDDKRSLSLFGEYFRRSQETLDLDSRLSGKFDTGPFRHNLVVGVEVEHENNFQINPEVLYPSVNLFAPDFKAAPLETGNFVYADRNQRTAVGVYGQDHIKLGPFALLAGGRYDSVDSRDRNPLDPASVYSKQNDSAFTGRVGLVYLGPLGLTPYASYSQSFIPIGGTDVNNVPFKPQTGDQVEAGVKFESRNHATFATLAVYRIVQSNVPTADPANPAFNIQIGEETHKGVELDAGTKLFGRVGLYVSYAYIDARVTKSNDEFQPGESTVGSHVAYTPANSATAVATYSVTRSITLNGSVLYRSKEPYEFPGFTTPGYTVFDIGATKRFDHFEVALNIKNLFDKRHYTGGSAYVPEVVPGDPLTILSSLRYKW